ncbi:MAG: caspase family protein [Pseudanabaena sp. CAN_BIN31]|nr:caspase family protein [Pseudanabaena sp. CAN_BIN31]
MAKKALLIGVSQYEAGLPPLAAAPKDVAAMLRVLQSPELGAFDEVTPLLNPDLEAMQTAIDLLFQSCQKGDLGLLYFSGHGITDDSDRLYLATRRTSKNTFKANSVSASFIQNIMGDHHHERQHVLILDCCYSGAFAEGWQAKSVDMDLKPQLEVQGSVVLTSSTSTEKSYEDKEGVLSLYTKYIVQGIESGAAEGDGDGYISADELHEYAKRHVQATKPAMKPEIYGVRQGIKILISKAKVDKKLEYRHLVEKYAHNGEIAIVGQDILELRREQWEISDEVANTIESEVLEPDRKRLRSLERYQKAMQRVTQQSYPLDESTIEHLKDLQEALGLRDEDIKPIEDQITYQYRESRAIEFFKRGCTEFHREDYQQALISLTKAISFKSNYIIAYAFRGWTLRRLDKESAEADLQVVINSLPQTAEDYMGKGVTKSLLEDLEGSLSDYTEAIRINPSDYLVYYLRGLAIFKVGDYASSINDYSAALEIKDDHAASYQQRGVARHFLEDHEEAISDLNRAIYLKPQDVKGYYFRGLSKRAIYNSQGALVDFRAIVKLLENQTDGIFYHQAQKYIAELGG